MPDDEVKLIGLASEKLHLNLDIEKFCQTFAIVNTHDSLLNRIISSVLHVL